MDHVVLTPPELEALRIVAQGGGRTTWYQMERVLLSCDYPTYDTNSVHLLAKLEELGLVSRLEKVGTMHPYGATDAGKTHLLHARRVKQVAL